MPTLPDSCICEVTGINYCSLLTKWSALPFLAVRAPINAWIITAAPLVVPSRFFLMFVRHCVGTARMRRQMIVHHMALQMRNVITTADPIPILFLFPPAPSFLFCSWHFACGFECCARPCGSLYDFPRFCRETAAVFKLLLIHQEFVQLGPWYE